MAAMAPFEPALAYLQKVNYDATCLNHTLCGQTITKRAPQALSAYSDNVSQSHPRSAF